MNLASFHTEQILNVVHPQELDAELLEVQRAAVAGRLQPLHAHETTHTATSALMGGVRQVR